MTKLSLLSVLLTSGVLVGTAHAQPAPPTPAPPTPAPGAATDDVKAQAKAKYETGLNHYNLGEFDLAIASFKEAYALTSAPGLLFNIAQSYRLKKDYEQASYFYKTYLRLKPDAANRADVEERVKEMDKMLDEQKAQAKLPPTGMVNPDGNGDGAKPAVDPKAVVEKHEVKPDVTPIKVDHVDRGGGKSLKLAGIATAGTGAALVITGVIFGSMASSKESTLNALSPNMGTWTADEQATYDAGKRDNTIAIATMAIGGAAIVGGAALWYFGHAKDRHTTVAIVPTKTGTMFAAGWAF